MPAFEIQPGQPDRGVCSARECRRDILLGDDGRLLVDASTSHWASCVARQRFLKPKKGATA